MQTWGDKSVEYAFDHHGNFTFDDDDIVKAEIIKESDVASIKNENNKIKSRRPKYGVLF